MAFPLLLRDVPGQTLLQTETLLRRWTTAGAAVAVQTETTPSGQAVFFDVLDGRWEPDYDGFLNRAGRRRGTLYLDTQPWGYWPTEILLASAASIGFIGAVPINAGASLIGDVPPLAHIVISPTVASSYAGFVPDMLAVSLGARPSFVPFIPAASLTGLTFGTIPNRILPSLIGDAFAPGSQAWAFSGTWNPGLGVAGGITNWGFALHTGSLIGTALEPAYRGRFRIFGFMRNVSSQAAHIFSIADAQRYGGGSQFNALASGNQLATVYPNTGTLASYSNQIYSASPAYSVLDMGEITLPPVASGVVGGEMLRVFMNAPTTMPATVLVAGLFLLPVDGAAGVLTGGLTVPSMTSALATLGSAEFNANWVEAVTLTLGAPGGVGGPGQPAVDGRALYRGLPLRLGASTSQLVFMTGDRSIVPQVVAQGNVEYARVSVSYRPSFQFLYGL
jgi:hypothetical protein